MSDYLRNRYTGNLGRSHFPANSTSRVLTKYPEYREKLENRELEFLHFKNLDIKVKDPDFEIKKIEEENCIVELREESYRMCENELRRIVRRIKVSNGRVIGVDIDEIKNIAFFANEAEKLRESLYKLNEFELKNKVEILSKKVPVNGIERELKMVDVGDLEKIFVKFYSNGYGYDRISEYLNNVEKCKEERERIKREIEELEREKKVKEVEMEKRKEKAELIEEIKNIERKIKEKKVKIREVEGRRKEEIKKVKEHLKELSKEIKKELNSREEKISKLNDAIEKIKKGISSGKKKEEILEEIKDPYVKGIIEKVRRLEIDEIERELRRVMNSLRDSILEKVLVAIEYNDMKSVKKYIEEMKKVVKVIEKLEEKIKSKDEIEIRKCIREISEGLPNEYKEIVENIKKYIDELLKKKGKISDAEYRKERDKCFLEVNDELYKLSKIKEVYIDIVKKIESIKKDKGISQKIVDIVRNILSKFNGEKREMKEIKKYNRKLMELYEKERKFLQICDELCEYIKRGRKEDLKKLLDEYGEFELDGVRINHLVSSSKMDPELFKREVRNLIGKINLKIKNIEEKKISLAKGVGIFKFFT